jgi:NIPSNAP
VPKTVQVRTYTVRPERLDEWVLRWRTQVVPLRLSLGFGMHGSWVDRERSQHIWVISYDGPQTFDEANAAYWASPRRAELGLDPSEYLVEEQIRTVEQVL